MLPSHTPLPPRHPPPPPDKGSNYGLGRYLLLGLAMVALPATIYWCVKRNSPTPQPAATYDNDAFG